MSTLALVGLLCFLVGVLVGVVADDAYELLKSHTSKPREWHMVKRAFCWLRNNTLILLVVMFAATQVALAVLLIQQRAATTDYVRCMSAWQQQSSASTAARVDAAKEVSEAMDRVMNAVASKDPEEFQAALHHYIDVRDKQVAAQEANPLPEPPQKVCGR